MLSVRSRFLPLCALMLAIAAPASAQEFRATVKGQVADTSQSALPGATVTVQNQDTNEVATATTNDQGAYTIPFLRPGLYNLTVELAGFQKGSRTNMRLEVGQVATINMELPVGALTETVNVTSEAPLLETSRADRGTVIDSARIAELPLQSRSPMALAVLVAGVNYNAQAIYLRPFDNGALADWSMNGGQNRNNEFLLDGVPNNANQGGNNIAYVPPAEAVQEFKVATNSYDAQYGRTAGGVVNMSLKSGTNTFHGVAYEFLRRKCPRRQLVPAERPQRPQDRPLPRSVRRHPRRSDHQEQDVLHVHRREVPRGHAGAAVQHGADRCHEARRLQRPGRRPGPPDHHLRPAHRPRRQRRLDARSVPGQPHPGRPHQPRRPRDHAGTTRRRTASPPASPRGSRTCTTPSTSTRTCSGTGSARSTTTSARTTAPTSAGPRTSATKCATRTAIRTGPAQDGQLPLIRANRAVVGDWVHVFGGGTVFNVRGGYTYFLEWSQSDSSFGFDSTEFGWPQSLVSQFPSQGSAACSRASRCPTSSALSRGTGPNTNKNWSLQPNISLTRGKHNIRSGLDMRWTNVYNDNYGNAGGFLNSTSSSPAAPSTAPTCSKATPSRRSCSARPRTAKSRSTPSPTTSGSSSRRGSRTTGASATS